MTSELIIIAEYCEQSSIDPNFIVQLEDEGLIEISIIDSQQYIQTSQLKNIEQYARLHYDLSVNVAGIDVIQNLLDKMDDMRNEMVTLKEKIRLIEWE